MTSFLYRAGSGVPGDITRQLDTIVEQAFLNSAKVPAAFGLPVKMTAGKLEKIEAGDTAASFYGILTRLSPSIAGDTAQVLGAGTPNANACQGVMVRGYCNVACTIGTPVRNGVVYMRVVAASGKNIGDLEATADGANNVALTGVVWNSDGKDSSNVAELKIK